jgi:dihydropteroate synthase
VQNTAFSTNKTLNVKGHLIDFREQKLMAILNVTPDSFFDGGRYTDEKSILARAETVLKQGATFIDVGGYSSRPGASNISEKEELDRVLPAIRCIARNFPQLFISVDTFRSTVARAAIENGASLVNDISAGALDLSMPAVISELQVPYIIMHMKGNPQNMMEKASYSNVAREVMDYFHQKVHQLHSSGIKDIIIDPGFGFSKTREHNFELLGQLELFKIFNKPVMAGLSRKSLIWKTLDVQPEDALNGTTVLNTIAVLKGVDIIRVHDVKEASQVITLVRSFEANRRQA